MSVVEKEFLPTEEDIKFYKENGYFISPVIFTEEEIDAAVKASEEFYQGHHETPTHPMVEDFVNRSLSDKDYGDSLRKHDYASLAVPALANLYKKPILGAIAQALSGHSKIRLWHDQLLYKPPQKPGTNVNVGWHTDRGYWMVCSSAEMLTAWIPFHDCDETIGTITMIEGSNRWPDNTQVLDFFDGDLEDLEKKFKTGGSEVKKVPMQLKKGQVSFHHTLTIHGSGPNLSDKPRRSMAVHLQGDDNKYQEFLLQNGKPAIHYNCIIGKRENDVPDFTAPEAFPVLYPQ